MSCVGLLFALLPHSVTTRQHVPPRARVDAAIRAAYQPTFGTNSISELDASCIPAMLQYIRNGEDGGIFDRVAYRLYQLHARNSIQPIIEASGRLIGASFKDVPVGAEAIRDWGEDALPALFKSIRSENVAVRRAAAQLLNGFSIDRPVPRGVTQTFLKLARSDDVELRLTSCAALESLAYGTVGGAFGHTDHAHHLRECAAVAALAHLSFDENRDVRHRALRALVQLIRVSDDGLLRSAYLGDDNGMSQHEKIVQAQFKNPLPQIRAAAVTLVAHWDWNFTELLEDPDPTVVDVTALGISHARIFISDRKIATFAKSHQAETRRMVAWLLGRDYSYSQLSVLKALAHDRAAPVRKAATESLKRIRRGPLVS